jgi:hypothetical protein
MEETIQRARRVRVFAWWVATWLFIGFAVGLGVVALVDDDVSFAWAGLVAVACSVVCKRVWERTRR